MLSTISRATAAILNDATVNKAMTVPEARTWPKEAQLEAYELSSIFIGDIRRAAR